MMLLIYLFFSYYLMKWKKDFRDFGVIFKRKKSGLSNNREDMKNCFTRRRSLKESIKI